MLKQESFPSGQYMGHLEEMSLEANIDNAIKRNLFINDLNGSLPIHLQLKQPHIYQAPLKRSCVKKLFKWESEESIMLQEALQKLNKIKTKK